MKNRVAGTSIAGATFALLLVSCSDEPTDGSAGNTGHSATGGRAEAKTSTAGQRPPVTVRTVEAQIGTATAWVIGEGTARAVEREYLTFENPGRIVHIKAGLRVGSRVRAGDLLARQDQRKVSSDVTTAQAGVAEAKTQLSVAAAELQQAKTEYEVAQTDAERYRVLLEKRSGSPQEYDQAKARLAQAEAAVERASNRIEAGRSQITSAEASANQTTVRKEETEIRSPIDGIVAYLNIEEGNYFTPSVVRTDSEQNALSTIPIVVIDTSRYEVTVEIPAFQRGRVEPDQRAILLLSDEFSQAALGRLEQGTAEQVLPLEVSEAFKAYGEVYAVNPTVSPGGRSVQVKIRTTKGEQQLQDGVYVTAWIATQAREETILVPLNALLYRDNQPFVFVVEDRRARLRDVTLGIQDFTAQEVLSGVRPREEVVTEGRFQLTDGAPVRLPETDQARPTSAHQVRPTEGTQ